MQVVRSLFFGLLLISLFSCKKKGDNQAPVVASFTCDKTSYLEGDTIWVNAVVNDETGLNSAAISISYKDNQEERVLERVGVQVSGQQATISVGIPINYVELQSGEHVLQLQVSDGDNTTNEFITIGVLLKTKVYSGAFLPVKNGNKVDIHFLNNMGNDSLYKSVTATDLYGMCNVKLGQLVLANGTSNLVSGYDIATGNLLWTNSVSAAPTADVNGFYHAMVDNHYYLSLASGYMKAIATDGATLMTSTKIGGGRVPKQLTITPKFMAVYSETSNGLDKKLELFNRNSGGLYITLPQAERVTALAYIEKERFAAFTVGGNTSKVTLYDNDANTETTSTIDGLTGLKHAETISSTAILCNSDQGIVMVNPSTGAYSFVTMANSPVKQYYAPAATVFYWSNGNFLQQVIGGGQSQSQGFATQPMAIWGYWK